MPLMDINGGVGTGKTTLAVNNVVKWYKKLEKEESLPSAKDNILCRANLDLDIPYFDFLEPQDLELQPNKIGTYVLIDESYTWLESRISMSKINRFMSYIVFQSRKRDLSICVTEQLRSSIDLRYKDMSDFTVFCGDRPNPKTSVEPFLFRIIKNSSLQYRDMILPYANAKVLFDKFKTEQIISPPDIEDLKADLISSNPVSLNKMVDKIVSDIKLKFPEVLNMQVSKITKDFVTDILLRFGVSTSYESFVYVRLRAQVQQKQDKK